VAQALGAILQTKQFVVERADQVMRALRLFNQGGADFADCLIGCAATAAVCESTMTFDVKASKHAGMSLIA
jgi:predicted nucleic-acid-binding protein